MPGPKYVNNFEFPSSFGFSGSSADRTVTTVRSHERKRPVPSTTLPAPQRGATPKRIGPRQKFAEGGAVDLSSVSQSDIAKAMKTLPSKRTPEQARIADAYTAQAARRTAAPPKQVAAAPAAPTPREEGKRSLMDAVRGTTRRENEQRLGLKKGGMPHYAQGAQHKYAKGGPVYDNNISSGHALQPRAKPSSVLDAESGGKSALRPGFKRGGRSKKAMGGPVQAQKGGPTADLAQDRRMIAGAIKKHVAAPKPSGHGVKSAGKMRGGRAC